MTIFGATGGTGQRLLERTIAEGHEVTAFVRNTSRMKARHERLEVVVIPLRIWDRAEDDRVVGSGAFDS